MATSEDVVDVKIFIIRDGTETGPYSWLEVFLFLQRGELDANSLVRVGHETRSIAAWGLWNEGSEAGPFTWDEVSVLLQEGGLDLNTKARFDGATQFADLRKLISRSREIYLDDPKARKRGMFPRPAELFRRFSALSISARAALAGAALLLCGLGIFALQGRHSPAAVNSSPPEIASVQPSTKFAKEAQGMASPIPAPPPHPAPNSSSEIPTKTALVELVKTEAHAPPTAVSKIADEPAPSSVEPSASSPLAASSDASEPYMEPSNTSLTAQNSEISNSSGIAKVAVPATKVALPLTSKQPDSQTENAEPQIGDFFKIQSVKFLKRAPKDGYGVWRFSEDKKKPVPDEFQPCLEVKAVAKENIRSEKLTAKAYFFDANNKLLATAQAASKAGNQSQRSHHAMPVLFYKDKPDRIFFEVPEKIRNDKWKAVVIFGDKLEAQSACFPPTESDFLLAYPEKELVYDRSRQRIARKPAMDPLIEHVVKTRNPAMPQITLFLRPPKGVSDASEVQGVLAICILASGLEEMKRELRKEEMPGDYAGLFSFANKHKLAIVAWGSRRLWDPGRNYDDLPKAEAREIDQSLDIVASAWERGVKELGEKYGIPQKDFLLWGNCGSAQWAQRLCLRKPEYFLAVHIHMPGSYDKPTPEAAKVLWCLTIGELEAGYERSKRWVNSVREMGYPIVYKAIPGLGHAGHPDATALGLEFYAFALSEKKEFEKDKSAKPESMTFQNPPYYGDMVNQELYPADQIDMIPVGFRIPLPNKAIAEIWARGK